jgi:aldehyde:ferredoxin oxidoreductase
MKYLYDEVPPGIEWSSPENLFMVMSGPLGGAIGGSGVYSVVTKGPMTNGAASSQASGYLGAFIKFAGFDGIIVEGASNDWVYLYVHDGTVEIRDAKALVGKNTWETQDEIERELDRTAKKLSTMTIGPGGENLVRFSCVQSDKGHIVAHNGVGAVMGSKKLKAIAVEKGKYKVKVKVKDLKKLKQVHKTLMDRQKKSAMSMWEGTQPTYKIFAKVGLLPVKNYTQHDWSEYQGIDGNAYRPKLDMKREHCWGCPYHHLHMVTIKEGPHKGFVGEEPEYEGLAAMGPLIGNKDPNSTIVACNEVDWLGLDINESGWIIAWLIECYEDGILGDKDTDGLAMTWGNMDAVRKMLRKIAYREGVGDLYAEGAMRAAVKIGGEAAKRAVYTKKGNTPRGHDHRTIWNTLLDTATSSMGSDEVSTLLAPPEALGLPKKTDRGTATGAAQLNAAAAKIGYKHLLDSLLICYLNIFGAGLDDALELLNAATGWKTDEFHKFGYRVNNLMRAFGMRHGWTADMDEPSPRYGSTSLAGAGKGKSILTNWNKALKTYYQEVGWDVETGKPLPETLKQVGLEHVISDLWP